MRKRLAMALPLVHGDVLELGCGNALILSYEQPGIKRYCGIDYNSETIQNLRLNYPQHTFICADLDDDPIKAEGKFDVILMLAIVEHIYNQKHLFTQVVEKLKPSGKIVLTTPTPFGNDIVHRYGVKVGLFAKLAAEDHIVIYNKRRFKILASDFNLVIEKYQTFEFRCNQFVVMRKANGD